MDTQALRRVGAALLEVKERLITPAPPALADGGDQDLSAAAGQMAADGTARQLGEAAALARLSLSVQQAAHAWEAAEQQAHGGMTS